MFVGNTMVCLIIVLSRCVAKKNVRNVEDADAVKQKMLTATKKKANVVLGKSKGREKLVDLMDAKLHATCHLTNRAGY